MLLLLLCHIPPNTVITAFLPPCNVPLQHMTICHTPSIHSAPSPMSPLSVRSVFPHSVTSSALHTLCALSHIIISSHQPRKHRHMSTSLRFIIIPVSMCFPSVLICSLPYFICFTHCLLSYCSGTYGTYFLHVV